MTGSKRVHLRFSLLAFVPGIVALWQVVAAEAATANPDAILEVARRTAAASAHAAPDYIVKRTIYRYRGVRAEWTDTAEGINFWQSLDTISGNLTLDHGNELYTNLTVNGFPAVNIPPGISTTGELSTEPLMILAPEAAAVFSKAKRETIGKHHTWRYDYSVDEAHSTWLLDVGRLPGTSSGQSCRPAFSGRIWIDSETGETVRIEASSHDLPKGFPLDWVDLKTDYDSVRIAGKSFSLPVHSNAYACMSKPEKIYDLACYWNDSLFSNYEKFSVDSDLHFNPAGR